jgi:ribosomal protein S18 acetylase RimI-like enzyme
MTAPQTERVITSPVVRPLDQTHDEAAAAILVDAVYERTIERAREIIAGARQNPDASLYGLYVDDELQGMYIVCKQGLANDVSYLAIRSDHRRQGHGRMCLHDALLRSGRRPLTLQTLESELPFYKKVGFRIVSRRNDEYGRTVYRLGWHAPIPKPGGAPGEVVC